MSDDELEIAIDVINSKMFHSIDSYHSKGEIHNDPCSIIGFNIEYPDTDFPYVKAKLDYEDADIIEAELYELCAMNIGKNIIKYVYENLADQDFEYEDDYERDYIIEDNINKKMNFEINEKPEKHAKSCIIEKDKLLINNNEKFAILNVFKEKNQRNLPFHKSPQTVKNSNKWAC